MWSGYQADTALLFMHLGTLLNLPFCFSLAALLLEGYSQETAGRAVRPDAHCAASQGTTTQRHRRRPEPTRIAHEHPRRLLRKREHRPLAIREERIPQAGAGIRARNTSVAQRSHPSPGQREQLNIGQAPQSARRRLRVEAG